MSGITKNKKVKTKKIFILHSSFFILYRIFAFEKHVLVHGYKEKTYKKDIIYEKVTVYSGCVSDGCRCWMP